MRMASLVAGVLLSLSPSVWANSLGGLADSPWPDYGGGALNQHRSTGIGPNSGARIAWEYKLPLEQTRFAAAFRQPSLGGDGTIYFTNYTTGISRIFALGQDGAEKWVASEVGGYRSFGLWVAVGANGHLYHNRSITHQAGTGRVTARSQADGSIVWQAPEPRGGAEQAGPTILPDGTVVGGSRISGLSPTDGQLQWTIQDSVSNYSNPAVLPDGTIYVGGRGGNLLAVDSMGMELWRHELINAELAPPSVDDFGNIYVGTANSQPLLVSLTPDGEERWRRSDLRGAPSIGLDGTVYATSGSSLFALNPDTGDTLWSYAAKPSEFHIEGVTIDAGGNLFMATPEGRLLSLDPQGSLRWELDLAPDDPDNIYPSAPVVGADGKIYVAGGYSRSFFAIESIPTPTASALAALACVWACSSPRGRASKLSRGLG